MLSWFWSHYITKFRQNLRSLWSPSVLCSVGLILAKFKTTYKLWVKEKKIEAGVNISPAVFIFFSNPNGNRREWNSQGRSKMVCRMELDARKGISSLVPRPLRVHLIFPRGRLGTRLENLFYSSKIKARKDEKTIRDIKCGRNYVLLSR